jgi:hypothetical protein
MLRHALSARIDRYSRRGIVNFASNSTQQFFDLRIQPLYAEDFFTVVERAAIVNPDDPAT